MDTCKSNIKRLESVQKYLFAYAFHLCGNVNDSKDLVQDTNIRILDNLDKFQYGDNFRGWCAVIMRNLYHNQCLRYRPVPVGDPAIYACDMLEDGDRSYLIVPVSQKIPALREHTDDVTFSRLADNLGDGTREYPRMESQKRVLSDRKSVV